MRYGNLPGNPTSEERAVVVGRSRWLSARVTVMLLAIAIVVIPAVALSSARRAHPLPAFAAFPAATTHACLELPEPDPTLCVCAAIAQAATRHPVMPFLLLAVVALLRTVFRHPRVPVYRGECGWPRNRRRAFLQVFLI